MFDHLLGHFTVRREFTRRARLAAACEYGLVQAIDRAAAVNVEHHADHRRSRTAMQAEHMVLTARWRENSASHFASRRALVPYRLVEAARLLEIAGNEFDAAHAADETGCHYDSPRSYEPPKSFFTCEPALPKSICPAKRCFSAAMVRPMSLSVSASISLIKAEMAWAASMSDIRLGR